MIDKEFWRSKRVFLTGNTGFKGSWLSLWLNLLGAEVSGYSLHPIGSPSLFRVAKLHNIIDTTFADIRDQDSLEKSMHSFNPDIIIHMAAQPLVKLSYALPLDTFEVNILGTARVLDAARSCSNLKAILNVTSDKCYENDGRTHGYKEDDPMGGFDPYSSSKGCSELVTAAYRRSFFEEMNVGVASARAGNVIGGGDWSDDRLIPDILRAFENSVPVAIRSPKSTRPWQHVLEPLSGYLILCQKLYEDQTNFSKGWNFGPNDDDIKTVEWILDKMVSKWPNSLWELDDDCHFHEAKLLKLDISLASQELGWKPIWNLNTALDKIIHWHKAWLVDDNMNELSLKEIEQYMRDMK